jgi:hypothetical protein
MKILNTEFTSTVGEDGKKKWNVEGPLAFVVLIAPLVVPAATAGFALGRLTKR